MRFLLVLSSLFLLSQAILNGHVDEWNKYAHLVKILARVSPTSPALACSGTLVSPGLVLTASDCVIHDGKKVSEIMVLVARATKPALRKRASLLQVNGTVAYLRLVHPMKSEEICPGFIASDLRVARLSIAPSLTRSPFTSFDWDKIDATTCRMVAFKSVPLVDDFLASDSIQTAVFKVEVEEEALIVRRVDTAVPAPCFEDAGAPFECLVGDKFIQAVTSNSTTITTTTTVTPVPTNAPKKEGEEEKADTTTTPSSSNAPEQDDKVTFSRCLTASTLRFSRLDILSVATFIEKSDFSGFVKMHEMCGLIQ